MRAVWRGIIVATITKSAPSIIDGADAKPLSATNGTWPASSDCGPVFPGRCTSSTSSPYFSQAFISAAT